MEDEKLDGSALCLLTEQHFTNHFGLKLGPTLKLQSAIHKQQQITPYGEVGKPQPDYYNHQPSAWFVPPNTPVAVGDGNTVFEASTLGHSHDLSATAATSLPPSLPPTDIFISPASHINATSADNRCSTELSNGMHSLASYNGSNCGVGDNPLSSIAATFFGSQHAPSSSTIPPEFNNFLFADPVAAVSAIQQQLLACSPLQHLFAAAVAASSSANCINPTALPFNSKFFSSNLPEASLSATAVAIPPENTASHATLPSCSSAVLKGFNNLSNSFAGNFGQSGGISSREGDDVDYGSSKTAAS